jgi:hypothetical protein
MNLNAIKEVVKAHLLYDGEKKNKKKKKAGIVSHPPEKTSRDAKERKHAPLSQQDCEISDFLVLAGEGRNDGSFGLAQGKTDVSSCQGAGV